MMIKHKTENNMSSSCLTRRSRNKDIMRLLDSRIKSENDRKEEQGRSMVEMLGVLAVVGVLSVGGIAGYTYAMNKHYANELLNGASQRAVILKAQKAAGLDLSLREFNGMEVAGGTFGNAEELEDGSAFIIPVSGVKGAVCENLIKATEGTDIAIAKDDGETLTDITEEECDDDNLNNLVFVFETGNENAGENGDQEKTHRSCNEWQCIDCPEGKEIVCSENGVACGCVTNPEDIDSWDCSDSYEGNLYCISCPDGQTPQCSEYGSGENACTCVANIGDTDSWDCGSNACITCPDGQTAKCSERGDGENACVCVTVPEDTDRWVCRAYSCISCSAGETLQCSERSGENPCICIPDGVKENEWACNMSNCISCPLGQKAVCGDDSELDYSLPCSCIDENSSDWKCNERACFSCSDGETLQCTDYDYGNCICISDDDVQGKDWDCNDYSCITCPDGQTAKCSSDGSDENACVCVTVPEDTDSWGCGGTSCVTCPAGQIAQCTDADCICVQDGGEKGKDWDCNDSSCITCPAGEIARCFPCSCACVKEWRDDDPREEDYSCMEGE